MSKSSKAILLSVFVFPGAGHIFLKKYYSAAALISIALGSLYYLIASMIEKVLQITEKIQTGEVPPDFMVITDLISQQLSEADSKAHYIATVLLIICWLISIIDSYRISGMK